MKRLICIMVILISFTLLIFENRVGAYNYSTKVAHEDDKEWTITFSQEIDESTLNDDSVYMVKRVETDKKTGKYERVKIETECIVDGNKLIIYPLEKYQRFTIYEIFIKTDLRSKNGTNLQEEVKFGFSYIPREAPIR